MSLESKPKTSRMFYVGTAGWNIPKTAASLFPAEGSHLQRYSSFFNAVEINSSFYRDHQAKTFSRWKQETPKKFRFSVKLFRRYTHENKLRVKSRELQDTLEGIKHLEEKLGVLLIQLPPKLEFDPAVAEDFFQTLRELYTGDIAFEPRNKTWYQKDSLDLLKEVKINLVNADPSPCGEVPRMKQNTMAYYRWHGTPVIYRSRYDLQSLNSLAEQVSERPAHQKKIWCIFDNTAYGYAHENAAELNQILAP